MFEIRGYIFTPKDIWNFLHKIFLVAKNSAWKDKFGVLISTILGAILIFYFHFAVQGIVFWLFFFILMFWNLDFRISIGLALAGLVLMMILSILTSLSLAINGSWSETLAVWVYFFLVIGVAKQIYDMAREKRDRTSKRQK